MKGGIIMLNSSVQYPPVTYQSLFCRFLYKYDSLRNFRSAESFERVKNGFIAQVDQIIGSKNKMLLHRTLAELKDFNKTFVKGEVIYLSGNAKIELDLIRHLRNSIAHGLLRLSGKFFIIEDYNDHSRRNLSAYGKIKTTKIKDLLENYIN